MIFKIEQTYKDWRIYGIENNRSVLWAIRYTKEDAIRTKNCLENPIL